MCTGIQEGDEVLVESHASIKHLLTGQWLHFDKTSKCFNSLDCFVVIP